MSVSSVRCETSQCTDDKICEQRKNERFESRFPTTSTSTPTDLSLSRPAPPLPTTRATGREVMYQYQILDAN